MRQLDISDDKQDKDNIDDLKTYGDSVFVLLSKASSDKEGFMKSTKVCNVPGGCVMQVTTQQRNPNGSYSLAEAIAFVPNVGIDLEASPRKMVTVSRLRSGIQEMTVRCSNCKRPYNGPHCPHCDYDISDDLPKAKECPQTVIEKENPIFPNKEKKDNPK